jgi:hypothetical protein
MDVGSTLISCKARLSNQENSCPRKDGFTQYAGPCAEYPASQVKYVGPATAAWPEKSDKLEHLWEEGKPLNLFPSKAHWKCYRPSEMQNLADSTPYPSDECPDLAV